MSFIVLCVLASLPALLDAQAVYKQLALAMGEQKLQQSISSSLTLAHSIQRVSSSQEEGKRIGCAPYLHALDLIRETATLQVIMASHTENAVCFLFDYLPTDLSGKLSFEYFVPAALKVHHKLYNVIQNLYHASRGGGATTSKTAASASAAAAATNASSAPRPSLFLSTFAYKDDLSSYTQMLSLARGLSRYDNVSHVMDNFYWTSAAHYSSFSAHVASATSRRRVISSNDSLALAKDQARFATWSTLSRVLIDGAATTTSMATATRAMTDSGSGSDDMDGHTISKTTSKGSKKKGSKSSSSSKNKSGKKKKGSAKPAGTSKPSQQGRRALVETDPCGFRGLAMKAKAGQGEVEIPISHLVYGTPEDASLRAACLVYIIATFAHSRASPVFFLALTKRPILLNFRSRSISQSEKIGASSTQYTPYSYAKLLGDGQVISVADTGVDVNNCYFYDPNGRVPPADLNLRPITFDKSFRKVIQYTYDPSGGDTTDCAQGHGTHVAGTLAGSTYSHASFTSATGQYDGNAVNAKLAVMDLSNTPDEGLSVPSSADLLYLPGWTSGARIHSNSWGGFFNTGDKGYYSSADTDGFLFAHQDMNIFFAAGNAEGSTGNLQYANSIEAQSKNVISVGSSESTLGSTSIEFVSYFSSWGPAYDGRIKPDIVAPGDSLVSASAGSSCGVVSKMGTSQATPSAASAAVLVRQYFADASFFSSACSDSNNKIMSAAGCASFDPSGVLIKALMIHSGHAQSLYDFGDTKVDVKLRSPPDFIQGYGRVSLKNILPLPSISIVFGLFVDDLRAIGSNDKVTYTVHVADATRPLKATLAWYDPPNQNGITTKALLNDLDLTLLSPGSKTKYVGNGKADELNTNEQIIVDTFALTPGDWTLTVSSKGLFSSLQSQPFSLVVTCSGYSKINGGGPPSPPSPPPPPAPSPSPTSSTPETSTPTFTSSFISPSPTDSSYGGTQGPTVSIPVTAAPTSSNENATPSPTDSLYTPSPTDNGSPAPTDSSYGGTSAPTETSEQASPAPTDSSYGGTSEPTSS